MKQNGQWLSFFVYKNFRETRFCNHASAANFRALDKREYLLIIRDNFCLFCIKKYVVTSHLNRLDETIQMRGHNIWFR